MTIPIEGRRIVLIGGAGFIGHHLALELHRRGAQVEIVDALTVNNLVAFQATNQAVPNRELYLHLINERIELLREARIPLHVQDARDYQTLSQLLNLIQPQVIVHLAAVAHAGKANKNPYTTFDHSSRTLENALDCARGNVEHFVYFSSSMVYGNFMTEAVTEDTHCDPIGIYGALKLGGEHLVRAYHQVFDLPFTIVRPSALYGERCVSRRVGQVFIENAFKQLDLKVSGDGSGRLDFTYVGDLVDGIVRIIENERSRNETFNLTYGSSRSIKDMVGILKEHFPDLRVAYEPSDALMPERGTLSVEKARNLLGYDPQYPLEEGLVSYIQWYRKLFENHEELLSVS